MSILVLVLALLGQGCSTRINQSAGGDALVSISTHTAVAPSTAVGTSPVASVELTVPTSKGN